MDQPNIPNLTGVAQAEDVSTISSGRYNADYINWARIMHYVRSQAPGWMPYAERSFKGSIVHEAPDGSCYLLVGFKHVDGTTLPPVPHGQDMGQQCSGRDIADGYVRAVCKAAALQFGLAWTLWSKDDPIEREASMARTPFDMNLFLEALEACDQIESINKLVELRIADLRSLTDADRELARKAIADAKKRVGEETS